MISPPGVTCPDVGLAHWCQHRGSWTLCCSLPTYSDHWPKRNYLWALFSPLSVIQKRQFRGHNSAEEMQCRGGAKRDAYLQQWFFGSSSLWSSCIFYCVYCGYFIVYHWCCFPCLGLIAISFFFRSDQIQSDEADRIDVCNQMFETCLAVWKCVLLRHTGDNFSSFFLFGTIIGLKN